MLRKLVLLLVILPLVDLYLLIQWGERIGGLTTLLWVLATAALGVKLARIEGTRMLRLWQQALAAGKPPEDGVISGVLVFMGGALLVVPGVITDVLGALLLVPVSRRLLARVLSARLQRAIEQGSIAVVHAPGLRDPFARAGGVPGPFAQQSAPRWVQAQVVEVVDVSDASDAHAEASGRSRSAAAHASASAEQAPRSLPAQTRSGSTRTHHE